MVKEEEKPSLSISRRRMRRQAEWKVLAQMSLAEPQHGGQPVLQLPGGLVGKGDGQDGPGGGGVQAAQPLLACFIPQPGPGVFLQKGQIVLGGGLRHLLAVGAPAVLHQVGDAVDEDGGLAAPRPRQQEEGPLGGQGGLLLLRVQPGELPGDGPPAGLAESQLLFVIEHM